MNENEKEVKVQETRSSKIKNNYYSFSLKRPILILTFIQTIIFALACNEDFRGILMFIAIMVTLSHLHQHSFIMIFLIFPIVGFAGMIRFQREYSLDKSLKVGFLLFYKSSTLANNILYIIR